MKIRYVIEKIIASILLFFLSPVIFLICIVIRLTSSGDIFYWSKRVGIENKIFLMPKFSTMKPETPKVATHLLKNPDQYYTKVGSFLRKTSLDEIPQMLNVIKGEMSIVGPRPLFPEDNEYFDKHYIRRLNVMPGITGLLQINERNTDDFDTWYRYDIEYIDNWSITKDIEIIIKTPFSLLNSKTSGK